MSQPAAPCFLYLQIPADVESAAYLEGAATLAAGHGGKVLAAARAGAVECLEHGTPAAAVLLVEFAEPEPLRSLWSDARHQDLLGTLGASTGTLAMQVPGLPYIGLPDMPDIPTTASVRPPEGRGPRAYMVIQGTGTDQERMDRYRDIILPMIAEQGAYYTAFEITGNVEVLAGEWPWGIYAISRWPDHAAGHAFWDSERYQNVAIPLRTGAGTFHVHFFTGTAG
ncbi:MAG: DUF1330 domain-containing protein [Xanthomonadales bacterium]|nr:DUF1330 domain-containing protein [Xanthomonadales bacterium]NIN58892.1 DUF1330 domain-containing protein [Xanthomonadales bacterium]NIN74161.1 DUF1330 domain-containing protein [Xanthomonadales bacterium]NIO13832.1 DUF1330 domain-containing protein [Xanthomonadales bacterium]NIP11285.1 DUF1330 domain-containing protein [Xanthomonadales bacterium]